MHSMMIGNGILMIDQMLYVLYSVFFSQQKINLNFVIFSFEKVRILNNGRIVNFHIDWSSGTAAIRGNKPINIYRNCKYYWEVLLKDRIFGTSMMIGLTTSKAKLYSDSYINLIGENKFGWVWFAI